jgi:hypothetical protein
MSEPRPAPVEHHARVVDIIEAARAHVTRSVNTAIVQAYWLIGREIVELEQHGEKRAGHGDEVIERLAQRLAGSVGQGLALARRGHEIDVPADVPKEPLVLEFLGLDERSHWRERDLEQAIIDRIEGFLLELGKGFCNEQILAACYQMYLPTEEELRAELAREREAAERALRLATRVNVDDKGSESSR